MKLTCYVLCLISFPMITWTEDNDEYIIRFQACKTNPCIHGLCIETRKLKQYENVTNNIESQYKCYCQNGYTGMNCQYKRNACSSSPCLNNATCVDNVEEYFQCLCTSGYQGKLCEERVNECTLNPCLNNGTCESGTDSYRCLCKTGYTGENCETDIGVCNTTSPNDGNNINQTTLPAVRCINGGKCVDGPGLQYYCICVDGFEGEHCEDEIDECRNHPCQNGGICYDLLNDFRCHCSFEWTGKRCGEQVLLCPGNNNPCVNGVCVITSRYYITDMENEELNIAKYEHSDNSSMITSNSTMCYCVPDYYGKFCEYRYDDCLPNDKCNNRGRCIDGINSFTCICSSGFTGLKCEINCDNQTSICSSINAFLESSILVSSKLSLPDDTLKTRISGTSLTGSGISVSDTTNDISIATTVPISNVISFTTISISSSSIHEPSTGMTTVRHISTHSSSTSIYNTLEPSFLSTVTSVQDPLPNSIDLSVDQSSELVNISSFETLTPTTDLIHTNITKTMAPETSSYISSAERTNLTEIFSPRIQNSWTPSTRLSESSGIYSLTPTIEQTNPSETILRTTIYHNSVSKLSAQISLTESIISSSTNMFEGDSLILTRETPIQSPFSPSVNLTLSSATDLTQVIPSTNSNANSILTSSGVNFNESTMFPNSIEITKVFTYDSLPLSIAPSDAPSTNLLDISQQLSTNLLITPSTDLTGTSMLNSFKSLTSIDETATDPTEASTTDSLILSINSIATIANTLSVDPSAISNFLTLSTDGRHTDNPSLNQESTVEDSNIFDSLTYTTAVLEPNSTAASINQSITDFRKSASPDPIKTSILDTLLWTQIPSVETVLSSIHELNQSVPIPTTSSIGPSTSDLTISVSPTPVLPTQCDRSFCNNVGKCYSDLVNGEIRFRCRCSLNYSGPRCDNIKNITIPYFTEYSKLLLQNKTQFVNETLLIALKLRPSSENGLVMVLMSNDEISSAYILLKLFKGFFELQFSCGSKKQTRFVDSTKVTLETVVDVTVSFKVSNVVARNQSFKQCSASLYVENATVPMSGTQILKNDNIAFTDLSFGAMNLTHRLPSALFDVSVDSVNGFNGCVYSLMVNGIKVNMVDDAASASDILQCESDFCETSPCLNEGHCVRYTNSWYCDCKSGYTGSLCERKTCQSSSCMNGGTCIQTSAGLGFICMCPYGTNGINCQKDIEIERPFYKGTNYGYSSYTSYARLADLNDYLEVRLMIEARYLSQSLLFFLGQEDSKSSVTDYVALGLKNGYVIFEYNLGTGSVSLESANKLSMRDQTEVRFGRHYRSGWLHIEGQRNVTGKSPGRQTQLHVVSDIFIGGHDSYHHILLPKVLPLTRGFQGCIGEVAVRTSPSASFTILDKVEHGRNVDNCTHSSCDDSNCYNGGQCLSKLPDGTYRCQCPGVWKPPDCRVRQKTTLCDVTCLNGGSCVIVSNDNDTCQIKCDCELGFQGRYCETVSSVAVPFFNGRNSFLAIRQMHSIRHYFKIEIEFRSRKHDGLLLYVAQHLSDTTRDFASISLHRGHVQLRFNLGTLSTTILTSTSKIKLGEWNNIIVTRRGTNAFLNMNGRSEKHSKSPPNMALLNTNDVLYLGGIPDLSNLVKWAVEEYPTSFEGCIRKLKINHHLHDFSKSVISGRNIENCNSSGCDRNICQNGGICLKGINDADEFVCNCTKQWTGDDCSLSFRCKGHGCRNGAECIPTSGPLLQNETSLYYCDCTIGYSGVRCQFGNGTLSGASLFFDGRRSYIKMADKRDSQHSIDDDIMFEFETRHEDGMILWTGTTESGSEDYLGIGLVSGCIHVTWSLGHFVKNEIITDLRYDDGRRHSFMLLRTKQHVNVTVDDGKFDQDSSEPFIQLNTDGIVYIGGFPGDYDLEMLTHGNFNESFTGCLTNITINGIAIASSTDEMLEGRNVKYCGKV
ncbi:Uncharacterised protein g4314 [Pycnogonum litorale]